MTSPYLDRPTISLAVALSRMLEKIEAERSDSRGAGQRRWCGTGSIRGWCWRRCWGCRPAHSGEGSRKLGRSGPGSWARLRPQREGFITLPFR
jgi:hypothetical protein